MLGKELRDLSGLESGISGTRLRGMGLLETETDFEEEKMRTRVTGKFQPVSGMFSALSGRSFSGYEIHMGRTRYLEKGRALAQLEEHQLNKTEGSSEGRLDGCVSGNVFGTYVHGIFDEPGIAETVAEALFKRKGLELSSAETFDYRAYREEQFDLLASELRKSLDMEMIYRILEEGIPQQEG